MNTRPKGFLTQFTKTVVYLTCRMSGLPPARSLSTSQWEVNDRSKSKLAISQEIAGPFCIH